MKYTLGNTFGNRGVLISLCCLSPQAKQISIIVNFPKEITFLLFGWYRYQLTFSKNNFSQKQEGYVVNWVCDIYPNVFTSDIFNVSGLDMAVEGV